MILTYILNKKIKFHAFIYAFFKNNKTKKSVLCIHKCILKKRDQNQKDKKLMHSNMHFLS